jgi:uncharacterized protein (DUF433 family)
MPEGVMGSQAAVVDMTTAEAAFVLGVEPSRVKKAWLNRIIEPKAGESPRKLAYGDVVFLRYYLTHPDLSAEQRAVLYRNVKLEDAKLRQASRTVYRQAVGRHQRARMLVPASQDGTLVVDLTSTIAEVSDRAAELVRLREAVETDPNGEPRLRNTDVPVYRVAALVKEIQDDRLDTSEAAMGFPSLSQEQIVTAYRYSLAYPKKGRPYSSAERKSLKSRLDQIEFPDLPEVEDNGE